jgi:hypothetical protein
VIDALVQLIPEQLTSRSGAVFYSGREAFSGIRPLYILGINPGGDPVARAEQSVKRHTDSVLHEKPTNWSEYRDESWGHGARRGTWRMQPRVLHLLSVLGLDPGVVPASNIVFLRSSCENSIEGKLREWAKACWPFHLRAIERLQVKVVLCFGKSAGRWVREQLGADTPVGEFIERNNRRWTSTAHRSAGGITVITSTHPSRADWTSPLTDPSELVRQALFG